jgi:hypothetical protein
MPRETRPAATTTAKKTIGPGPFLAKVVGHLDPSFMGGLQVTLLRRDGNLIGDANQTYTVHFATPFYGSTAYEFMGANKADFNDTQKSYGMWFVPPDVGVTVICFFINGDPAQGYWMGCVPSRFMNHMVPAIGASTEVELTDQDKARFNTTQPLPVGEVNRLANTLDTNMQIDKIKKPVHPIAERFLEQGLLEDDVRGPAQSTPRRNVPNMVFGISTPGPLDRRDGAIRKSIGLKQSQTPSPVPVSRLGGTQLVFDDGDDQLQRKKPAGQGPREYADTLNGEKGDPTIPANEYFRVRTRTGHQILLHNTEDLIYIANSKGSTWIELTSNGKIDIFAEDSVSIHTKNDFNFYADRDFNLECGRNVNIKAKGRLNGDFLQNIHLRSGLDMKVFVSESLDYKVGTDTKFTTGNNLDVAVGGSTKLTSLGTTDIYSSSSLKVTSGATIDVGAAGKIVISGSRVDINGPKAATAAQASSAVTAPPLSTHDNIATAVGDWAKTKYQSGTIPSIMKRIPMHEPWALHESNAPEQVNPPSTDRDDGGDLPAEHQAATDASKVSASAAHVAEINDYDAVKPDPVTGKPNFPESIDIPSGGINLTADYFAPSKYGKRTAENLNTLDPSVRVVFAKAIKAFVQQYYKDGWDMSVSECLRPLARSKALYEAFKAGTGPQAASPGNSWHNYGAAADILIYKDGKWDSLNKLGAYTGFAQQFLRQQGIHNNAGANDSGHFVPVQMPVGVPSAVKNGSIKISQIMSGEKKV